MRSPAMSPGGSVAPQTRFPCHYGAVAPAMLAAFLRGPGYYSAVCSTYQIFETGIS